jgi:hypothetical protein
MYNKMFIRRRRIKPRPHACLHRQTWGRGFYNKGIANYGVQKATESKRL